MPPKRETHSGVGVPAGDQNVDAGVGQHDGLPLPPPNPPIPPISHMGRGAGLKQVGVDTGKRAIGSGLPGRQGKRICDGRFRLKRR
ncbi:hypothetical protein V6N13_019869 [Hibiscus sabdariffa]